MFMSSRCSFLCFSDRSSEHGSLGQTHFSLQSLKQRENWTTFNVIVGALWMTNVNSQSCWSSAWKDPCRKCLLAVNLWKEPLCRFGWCRRHQLRGNSGGLQTSAFLYPDLSWNSPKNWKKRGEVTQRHIKICRFWPDIMCNRRPSLVISWTVLQRGNCSSLCAALAYKKKFKDYKLKPMKSCKQFVRLCICNQVFVTNPAIHSCRAACMISADDRELMHHDFLESPFGFVFGRSLSSFIGNGWMPKNCANGESLKSVCKTQPVVAVGKASVNGNASSAKPRMEITVPPNKVRNAKASRGANATSPNSPTPGKRNVASPDQTRMHRCTPSSPTCTWKSIEIHLKSCAWCTWKALF